MARLTAAAERPAGGYVTVDDAGTVAVWAAPGELSSRFAAPLGDEPGSWTPSGAAGGRRPLARRRPGAPATTLIGRHRGTVAMITSG